MMGPKQYRRRVACKMDFCGGFASIFLYFFFFFFHGVMVVEKVILGLCGEENDRVW